MELSIISEILGWTSVAFYIGITIFNSMKFTRFAAFASAANDLAWSLLMQWWPKFILNLAVSSINTYRYAKDFTKVPNIILNALAAVMILGISYIGYVSVSGFLADPTLQVGLQYIDLAFILIALYMTDLKKYRYLMLCSGFVGMGAYYGNTQMMIIKGLVIGIMVFKLFIDKSQREEQTETATVNNLNSTELSKS